MLGPKSDNAITDGDGNTQIGSNTGSITVGLTFEQHTAALEKAIADKEALLERAHTAEKDLLRREVGELNKRLADVENDYKDRLQELTDLKSKLAQYDNQIERDKLDAAYAALDRDDTTLASALFSELITKIAARREDDAREEAKLHFELGKIAEAEVRWVDAAAHYARAAGLNPDLENLFKAQEFSYRSGDYPAALGFGQQALAVARGGADEMAMAKALNDHAALLKATGRFDEAEPLYRQALDIGQATLGPEHPAYATRLNNLAALLEATGRFDEAEPLYRQALEIGQVALGPEHPAYAIWLNNLAALLEATGRFDEAEPLYRQALEIGKATLGPEHPDYAAQLNNLAWLLWSTGRQDEALPMVVQALKITQTALGPDHPTTQIFEANLAELRKVLAS